MRNRERQKKLKLFLGALTLLPLLLSVLLFVGMWFMLSTEERGEMGLAEDNGASLPLIPILVVTGLLTVVLALGLQAFYVAHAYSRATPAHRWFWIVFVIVGQHFAMPVYWYFNIWNKRPDGG